MLRIALFLFLASGQAAAGAWPRGAGNTFLSFGHTLSADPATFGAPDFDPSGHAALLVERGVSARLTFGLDAGLTEAGDGTALILVTRALGPLEAANWFAVQAGLGAARTGGGSEALAQLGASWGRGLDTPWGGGWAAADAAVLWQAGRGGAAVKLDLTLGAEPRAGLKLFVQAQAGRYPGADPYLRLVPSMAWEFAPGRHIEVGVPMGIAGDRDAGVKIGTWIAF